MTLLDLREQEDIIGDFIESTPRWAEQMKHYTNQFNSCTICGMRPDRMMQLANKLKELREEGKI